MKWLIHIIATSVFVAFLSFSCGAQRNNYNKLLSVDTVLNSEVILTENVLENKDSLLNFYQNTIYPKIKTVLKDKWRINDKKDLSKKTIIIIHHSMHYNKIDLYDTLINSLTGYTDSIYKRVEKIVSDTLNTQETTNILIDIKNELDHKFSKQLDVKKSNYDNLKLKLLKNYPVTAQHEDTVSKNFELIRSEISKYQKVRGKLIDEINVNGLVLIKEDTGIVVNVLNVEKEKGKLIWTDELVHEKDILLLILDGKKDLINSKIGLDKLESSFSQDFNEFIGLVEASVAIPKGATQSQKKLPKVPQLKIRVVEIKRNYISLPANLLLYTNTTKKDTIEFKIEEKVLWSIRVGVTHAQITAQQFKLENGKLTIGLDSAAKEEWKNHLFVTIGCHPFRRGPIYNPRINNWSRGNRFQRLGIITGMNMSTKPFNNLYFGVSFDLTPWLTLNGGLVRNRIHARGILEVGDATSVKQALKFSKRKETEIQMFAGLSFSPSEMIKILGLKKENK